MRRKIISRKKGKRVRVEAYLRRIAPGNIEAYLHRIVPGKEDAVEVRGRVGYSVVRRVVDRQVRNGIARRMASENAIIRRIPSLIGRVQSVGSTGAIEKVDRHLQASLRGRKRNLLEANRMKVGWKIPVRNGDSRGKGRKS